MSKPKMTEPSWGRPDEPMRKGPAPISVAMGPEISLTAGTGVGVGYKQYGQK